MAGKSGRGAGTEKVISAIVAGTGFLNEDGESRAAIIRRRCRDGAPVDLERDPRNTHDPSAIRVYLTGGSRLSRFLLGGQKAQIGFLKAPLAARLAPLMDRGVTVTAEVSSFFAPEDMDHPRVSLELRYKLPGK